MLEDFLQNCSRPLCWGHTLDGLHRQGHPRPLPRGGQVGRAELAPLPWRLPRDESPQSAAAVDEHLGLGATATAGPEQLDEVQLPGNPVVVAPTGNPVVVFLGDLELVLVDPGGEGGGDADDEDEEEGRLEDGADLAVAAFRVAVLHHHHRAPWDGIRASD